MPDCLHTALIDIARRNGLFVAHTGLFLPLYEFLAVFENIMKCGDDREKTSKEIATRGVTHTHNTIVNGASAREHPPPSNTSSSEQFSTRATTRTGSARHPSNSSRARGTKLGPSINRKTNGLDKETMDRINRHADIDTLHRSNSHSFIPPPF
jgi:hypothetical protein